MSDWSEIVEELHKRAQQDEQEAHATSQRVREQLLNDRSSFLKEFTEIEKRLFGLINH